MIKRPEILSPCGNEESFEAALASGADAVYLAGNAFGARAYAGNFHFQDLPRIIRRAHLHGVRVYLTLNTLMKDAEFSGLAPLLRPLDEAGLDACLVQDPGLFMWLRRTFPQLPLHASTQMNITGPAGAVLLREMGATRIVAAREMRLEEIVAMKKASGLEAEVFVHGAMCVSYSGRCLFSSAVGERSGNRGRCAQPCRKRYGDGFPLSMKDLSALPFVPALVEAGVDSLKIEGRMKQPVYTAVVTEVYREAADAAVAGTFTEDKVAKWEERLQDAFSRGEFGRGYLFGGKDLLTESTSGRTGSPVGKIEGIKAGRLEIRAARHILTGDELHPEGREEIRLTSDRDIPEGGLGELAAPKTGELRKGMRIIRSRSCELEHHLAELLRENPRKHFRGAFTAVAGAPMELTLSSMGRDEAVCVTVSGEIPLPAEKREASAEEVREKLLATGGTEFVCDALEISLSPGLFLRGAALKSLRREGLARLTEAVEDSWKERKTGKAVLAENARMTESANLTDGAGMKGEAFFFVAANPKQASFLLRYAADHKAGDAFPEENRWLIADGGYGAFSKEEMKRVLAEAEDAGFFTAVGLPHISRMPDFVLRDSLLETAKNTDGIYIRCIEDLAEVYIRRQKGERIPGNTLILASSLYAFNQEAVGFYVNLFPGATCILEGNTELTDKEVPALDTLCRIYGREELMLTSALPQKQTKEGQVRTIRDEKAHDFFIFSPDGLCYNILLNGVPLSLHGENPRGGFLHFTTETERDMEKVFQAVFVTGQAGYPCTKGHRYKGVL